MRIAGLFPHQQMGGITPLIRADRRAAVCAKQMGGEVLSIRMARRILVSFGMWGGG